MYLTARQLALYVYAVDVWRSGSPASGADAIAFTRIGSAIPCLYGSAAGWEEDSSFGELDSAKLPLLGMMSFPLAANICDLDRLQLVSAPNGSADVGTWFAVVGEPQRNGWRANRLKVLVRPSSAPEGF